MVTDFLIIGSGIAGLSFAFDAAKLGNVVVVTKKTSADTATNRAQGGVAAVLDENDSFEEHICDTLKAGDGLCDEDVVKMVVSNGPSCVRKLIKLGVDFAKNNDGGMSLGMEGGHSKRRVAHAGDLTGREIETALLQTVQRLTNVEILENNMCVDLLIDRSLDEEKCVGGAILNSEGELFHIYAKIIVLCTGGAGKVYLYTSNPDIATGDGIAIAARAGAVIENMEFVQFHPTCLFHHQAKNFLISEAVRGEGAYLLTAAGERFMARYEPEEMELATRDKVARAIDEEMKKTGVDCVFLDISHKPTEFVKNRFPNIFSRCKEYGIDITDDSIPVVPAAHYLCGGVKTDYEGQTSIKNLFALGETASTGLHGGNRLASNSLLEAVVFAHNAYAFCKRNWREISENPKSIDMKISDVLLNGSDLEEEILINHNWDTIRRTMWNYVGIVRRPSRLLMAEKVIEEAREEIRTLIEKYKVTHNMLELRNISLVASLIIKASLRRKESRGLHYILE